MNPIKIKYLKRPCDNVFLNFLNKDKILHFFTIYDLLFEREKSEVWIAYRNKDIISYLFQFDKKHIHTRGESLGIIELLKYIDLDECQFAIEPHHLDIIRKFYQPIEPSDPANKGEITKFRIMKLNPDKFKPIIKHPIKKLGPKDTVDVLKYLDEKSEERYKIIKESLRRSIAYGAYYNGKLASYAMAPGIMDNIALIRGLSTIPHLRNRGLTTSASSALIKELLHQSLEPVLWVAEDNIPAKRLYTKMGFEMMKYFLLGFKGKKHSG